MSEDGPTEEEERETERQLKHTDNVDLDRFPWSLYSKESSAWTGFKNPTYTDANHEDAEPPHNYLRDLYVPKIHSFDELYSGTAKNSETIDHLALDREQRDEHHKKYVKLYEDQVLENKNLVETRKDIGLSMAFIGGLATATMFCFTFFGIGEDTHYLMYASLAITLYGTTLYTSPSPQQSQLVSMLSNIKP